jgi:hypothetical protein
MPKCRSMRRVKRFDGEEKERRIVGYPEAERYRN